jgi:hypothetical protein
MPDKTKEVQTIVVRKPTPEELENILARVVLSLHREGKL